MKVLKIGQIVPSSNVTMEREVPEILNARMRMLPERFSFHSSRVRMHRVVAEELQRMNREMGRCVVELSDAKVDIMSTACLVATMAMGPGYHRHAIKELKAAIVDEPYQPEIMTSAGALVEELVHFGAKKVSIMAPYSDQLTKMVVSYIENEGVEVKDVINFRIEDNIAVGSRDPEQLLNDVKRLDVAGVDTVILSACVQMPSLPAIEKAQRMLGIPVTSTAVCTARQMLRFLDLPLQAPGAGAYLGDSAGL